MSHPDLSPVWQTTPPTGEGSGMHFQAILFWGTFQVGPCINLRASEPPA